MDIFAFQELTPGKLDKYSFNFVNYVKFDTKSSLEQMYTYIKKIHSPILIKGGEFEPGRPYLINTINLNNKIVLFINVHPGNKRGGQAVNTLEQKDLNKLRNDVKNINFERLILSGDFNRSPNYVELKNKNNNEIKALNIVDEDKRNNTYTCCNEFRRPAGNASRIENKYGYVDNVLDSYYNDDIKDKYNTKLLWDDIKIINPDNNMGSDHCPIVAKLPYTQNQTGGASNNTNSNYNTYNYSAWNKIGNMYVNENKKLGGCRKI